MLKLSIDIETYSGYDLSDVGVYKYTESPEFTILLFAYAFGDEPVQVVDLASGEVLPDRVMDALTGLDDVELCAHNAAFERICVNKHFNIQTDIAQWSCTMVHASMLGLPLALGQAAKVLGLAEQKDNKGKALIRLFCQPNKTKKPNVAKMKPAALIEMFTEAYHEFCAFSSVYAIELEARPKVHAAEWDAFRTICAAEVDAMPDTCRVLPTDEPEKWAEFVEYCRQDVVVERQIRNKIAWFEVPAREKQLWYLDQRINDTGVQVDMQLIRNAIRIDSEYRARLEQEAIELTGLDNPNSVSQLRTWLETETGNTVDTLRKDDVNAMLKEENPAHVARLLTIRQEMSKTSNKKYNSMTASVCADGRVRGLLQFNGANRTGRWAGRLIQVQNLPKNFIKDLDIARQVVAEGDGELLEALYGNVPDTLSQLIRTAFVAATGSRFIVCDAAAIEARIVAWLANESWRLEVFATHGKIYEASAAQMFKVPLESVTKESPLRQKGKIAELALGYGGGPNALITMGALKQGLDESELQPLVNAWRNANPAIVRLWRALESAAITAVGTGEPQKVKPGITFFCKNNILFVQLPSGRCLSYMRPKLKPGKFGGDALTYEGLNQTNKQWTREDTYGGKLTENITQAVARDCLAAAMTGVDAAGYKVCLHVHDEIVAEMPEYVGTLAEVEHIMSQPLDWAKGLPLGADGFESFYYKK